MPDGFFDLVLAGLLATLAWGAMTSRELFRAVVLFIAFGFLMALAWVRLAAPDLALAEAAIGAGLTGALLLDAARQVGDDASDASAVPDDRTNPDDRTDPVGPA